MDEERTSDGGSLAEQILRLRLEELLPKGTGTRVTVEASDVLPHRAPMLLLDELIEVDPPTGRIRARRRLDPKDPLVVAHSGSLPTYPPVLLIEMMVQAALAALPFLRSGEASVPIGFWPQGSRIKRVREAMFIAPVMPGDTLDVHAEAIDDGNMVHALGQIYSQKRLAAYVIADVTLDE
jgi:3-hydroxymyristoyl/3-hydroxydecanoyl-(acyl carrier protein) dehydratase